MYILYDYYIPLMFEFLDLIKVYFYMFLFRLPPSGLCRNGTRLMPIAVL